MLRKPKALLLLPPFSFNCIYSSTYMGVYRRKVVQKNRLHVVLNNWLCHTAPLQESRKHRIIRDSSVRYQDLSAHSCASKSVSNKCIWKANSEGMKKKLKYSGGLFPPHSTSTCPVLETSHMKFLNLYICVARQQ